MAARRNTGKNQAIYALVSGAVDTLPESLSRGKRDRGCHAHVEVMAMCKKKTKKKPVAR